MRPHGDRAMGGAQKAAFKHALRQGEERVPKPILIEIDNALR